MTNQSESREMGHTPYSPLPWHVVEIGRNDVGAPVCVVRSSRGAVAEYLAEDDANYIARAGNSHAALVEALTNLAATSADKSDADLALYAEEGDRRTKIEARALLGARKVLAALGLAKGGAQ